MQNYQLALYGIMTLIGVGVIQFFVTSYLKKSEKLRAEKIDSIIDNIKLLSNKLDAIESSINNHNTDIALMKDKQQSHEDRINDHATRLRQVEQKINS